MKKYLLHTLFTLIMGASQAQTTLDTAVNFAAKDIYGNTIELFDILDEGQMVVIDFFSTA